MTTRKETFTREEVQAAVNRAASDIEDRADGEEVVANLMSLVVNAALTYLDDPERELLDVADCFEHAEDADPGDVIDSYLP